MATILEDDTLVVDRETVTKSIWPTAVRYGLIYAVASFALTLVFYNVGLMELNDAGKNASFIPSIAGYILLGAVTYVGLREFRDSDGLHDLPTIRGIKWSAAFGLIIGCITLVLMYLFFAFIAPEYLDQVVSIQEAAMEDQGMSSSETEAAMEYVGMFTSAGFISLVTAIGGAIIGFIAGSILTLFLKTA